VYTIAFPRAQAQVLDRRAGRKSYPQFLAEDGEAGL
jgi:hypothetical protein